MKTAGIILPAIIIAVLSVPVFVFLLAEIKTEEARQAMNKQALDEHYFAREHLLSLDSYTAGDIESYQKILTNTLMVWGNSHMEIFVSGIADNLDVHKSKDEMDSLLQNISSYVYGYTFGDSTASSQKVDVCRSLLRIFTFAFIAALILFLSFSLVYLKNTSGRRK